MPHLHGHRYALEITLEGEPVDDPTSSDHGMLMDFTDVKAIAKEHLVDLWDHAFLVHDGDALIVDLLAKIPGHKTVVLDRVPTAENLGRDRVRHPRAALHRALRPWPQAAEASPVRDADQLGRLRALSTGPGRPGGVRHRLAARGYA